MIPENKKYVYLYKITFKKDDEELFYVGIRTCICHPYDDVSYFGSPKAFPDVWQDASYIKTKDILKIGLYDEVYESFRDEEPILIKEYWSKYGLYGKGGFCLNGSAGKVIHPSFLMTGENHPMLNPETKQKVIQTKREKYGKSMMTDKGKQNVAKAARDPDRNRRIAESRKQMFAANPERKAAYDEKIRAAISGDKSPSKRPERRKQLSEFQKKRVAEGKFHLFDPKNRSKAAVTNKKRYELDPSLRKKASDEANQRFAKDPMIRERMSDARKKWYAENPDKAKLKNKKAAETRKLKKLENCLKHD